MSPTVTTFLFEAANFLVLAAVLGWLFFQPVRDAILRRSAALQQQSDDASKHLAEAQRLESEMELKLSDLETELDRRREQVKVAAEQQAELIVGNARETVRREMEISERHVDHLEQSKRANLARVIAETAGAAVNHLLRQLDQPDLDHALVAAACHEIQLLDGNSLSPVRIETARPMDQSDRDALKEALGDAAESAEFHVVDDLGIGLRITTNHGLVDVSAKGLSLFAEHQLSSRLASNLDGAAEGTLDG